MRLLVSIHDVAPLFQAEVRVLWRMCRAYDIRPALLVVPNWHGAWLLEHYPDFVAWLRTCAAEGAEIVLHGERHDEAGLSRSWRDGWRAWGRTAGEGEFLSLDRQEAAARIARGLSLLTRLGLQPVGFVPPAWLAREEGFEAARQAGLRFSEDQGAIRLFAPPRRLPAPVVRWSGRTSLRAVVSVLVAEARWLLQRRAAIVRLALHPQDLRHAATRRSVARALRCWTSVRQFSQYAALWAEL